MAKVGVEAEPARKACQVMLVEEDKKRSKKIEAFVKFLGHEVTTYDNGLKALKALREPMDEPEVLLLSMDVSGWSGADLLCKVRQKWDRVKVIVCSNAPKKYNTCLDIIRDAQALLMKSENLDPLLKSLQDLISEAT